MSAWEIFAMFAGMGVLIASVGVAVFFINKSKNINVIVDTPSIDDRMATRGFTKNFLDRDTPMWTYKETTTYTKPKSTRSKPQTSTKAAQPTENMGSNPPPAQTKEKN